MDLPVRVSARAFSQREGRLADLSVSGARLAVALPVRLLARVEVTLLLPRRFKHVPTVSGYVARIDRDVCGIEWCQFAPPAVNELLRTAVRHRYAHWQLPTPKSAMTRSRISGALLKHGA